MSAPAYLDGHPVEQMVLLLKFLKVVPPDELDYFFTNYAHSRDLHARDTLYEQGAALEHIFLLLSGEIQEARLKPAQEDEPVQQVLRRVVSPGGLLARYDLIFQRPYSTTARALISSTVVAIDAGAMNRLLQRYPEARLAFAEFQKIGRLRTVPLLGAFDMVTLGYLADASEPISAEVGETVYSSGDNAQYLYVIDQGQVRLNYPQEEAWLGNGATFGHPPQPRIPTREGAGPLDHLATATCRSTLFRIHHRAFFDITGHVPAEDAAQLQRSRTEILEFISVFQNFTHGERMRLAGFASHYHVPIHHVVTQQGEVGDSMWILMRGSNAQSHALDGSGQALPKVPLTGPSYHNEIGLLADLPLDSTVEALPDSEWLRIHRRDFALFDQLEGSAMGKKLHLGPEAQRMISRSGARETFTWLSEGEALVALCRRHWIALIRNITPSLILLGLMVAMILLFTVVIQDQPIVRLVVVGVLAFLAVAQFAWGLLDYLNDYLMVTNQRVVRQEKVIFLKEWQQVAFLDQIQNVDIVSSLIGNLLGYGIIRIQTAGTHGSIEFDFLPDPALVKSEIFAQRSKRQSHSRANSRLMIQRLLEERFGLRPEMPSRVRVPEGTRPEQDEDRRWWERLLKPTSLRPHMRKERENRIIWRKHWILLLRDVTLPMITLFLILLLVLGVLALPFDIFQEIGLALEFVLALVGVGVLVYIAWVIADWRNDTYEVGSTDIVDVEKKPLFFAENRRTARLSEIENIELDIPGPLSYLLNFGNVTLQTAATEGDFTFDAVPDPRGVAEELRRRIDLYNQGEEERRTRQRAAELPDWFETYSRLDDDIEFNGRPRNRS